MWYFFIKHSISIQNKIFIQNLFIYVALMNISECSKITQSIFITVIINTDQLIKYINN